LFEEEKDVWLCCSVPWLFSCAIDAETITQQIRHVRRSESEKIFIATWNQQSRLVLALQQEFGSESIVFLNRQRRSWQNMSAREKIEEKEALEKVPWNLVDALLLVRCRHVIGHPISSFSLTVYLWRSMDTSITTFFRLSALFGLLRTTFSSLILAVVLLAMCLLVVLFRNHLRKLLILLVSIFLAFYLLPISTLSSLSPLLYHVESYLFLVLLCLMWNRRKKKLTLVRNRALFVALIGAILIIGLCVTEVYSSLDRAAYSEEADFVQQTRLGVPYHEHREWTLNETNLEINLVGIELELEYDDETTSKESENWRETDFDILDRNGGLHCQARCRLAVRCVACNYHVPSKTCSLLARVQGAVWYPDTKSMVLRLNTEISGE
jgi:hypothetical protein